MIQTAASATPCSVTMPCYAVFCYPICAHLRTRHMQALPGTRYSKDVSVTNAAFWRRCARMSREAARLLWLQRVRTHSAVTLPDHGQRLEGERTSLAWGDLSAAAFSSAASRLASASFSSRLSLVRAAAGRAIYEHSTQFACSIAG